MSWEKNEKFVLETLKRLDEQHQDQIEKLDEIHSALVRHQSDTKWEFRILSAIWGVLVTTLNLSLKKFGI